MHHVVTFSGKPNNPYGLVVDCLSQYPANVSWVSSFNGGLTQTFHIGYRTSSETAYTLNNKEYLDAGKGKIHFGTLEQLSPSTTYFFVVYANNSEGQVMSELKVNCTTEGRIW